MPYPGSHAAIVLSTYDQYLSEQPGFCGYAVVIGIQLVTIPSVVSGSLFIICRLFRKSLMPASVGIEVSL